MSAPYLGQILIVAGSYAPKGYALCNGQTLAINQNQALFAVLGTAFGGNGTTTFQLPNLQGTAALHSGASQGPGLTSYAVGQTTGSEGVALTVAAIPTHTHTPACNSALGTSPSPSQGYWAQGPSRGTQFGSSASGTMASGAVGNTGAGQPHQNIQPVLVLNYVIALQGIFPSRS